MSLPRFYLNNQQQENQVIDNAQAAFLKLRLPEPQQWLTEPDPSAKVN